MPLIHTTLVRARPSSSASIIFIAMFRTPLTVLLCASLLANPALGTIMITTMIMHLKSNSN